MYIFNEVASDASEAGGGGGDKKRERKNSPACLLHVRKVGETGGGVAVGGERERERENNLLKSRWPRRHQILSHLKKWKYSPVEKK